MKEEIFSLVFRKVWKTMFLLLFCLSIAGSTSVFGAETADFHGYLVQLDTGPRLLSEEHLSAMEEICASEGFWQVADWESVKRLQAEGILLHVEPDYTVTLDDPPPEEIFFTSDAESAFSNSDFLAWTGAKANLKNLFPRAGVKPELADADSRPNLENQWYLTRLEVDFAQTRGITGQGVRVGVIDSGIFAGHEDFEGVRILSGTNYCVSANDSARQDTTDTYGHGTFVSGLIAAAVNGYGIAGISPDVELVPLKCFEGKNGDISNIARAIYDSVNVYHCQVLNLSLGLTNESVLLRSAIQYAASAGVIITAAAGNLTTGSATPDRDPLYYPAAYAEVIGIGAVGQDLAHASFSSRNESVWVVAPGSNLQSLSHKYANGYKRGSGTSYASPIVAAAAALALSVDASLSSDEFANLLRSTAEDLGDPGYDITYGYGLLQIGEIVRNLLIQTGQELPDPTPTPTGEPTPTAEPTGEPTPTAEPTGEPTPTVEPTGEPTPTAEPTGEPTPTAEPTGEPTPTPVDDTPLSLQIAFQSPDGRELQSLSDWTTDSGVQASGELRAEIALNGIPEQLREMNLLLAVYDRNQSLEFYHLWQLDPLSDSVAFSETIAIPEEIEAVSGKVMLLDETMTPLLSALRIT